jgi:hypothetical protein
MDDQTLKTKERILAFLLMILILLIPISLLFEEKEFVLDITNVTIEDFSESERLYQISYKNTGEHELDCRIEMEILTNKSKVDRDIKTLGKILPNEEKQIEIILTFPQGESVSKLKPICSKIYKFP